MQKRYGHSELIDLVSKTIIPEKGKSKIRFETEAKLGVAEGYTRLQTSAFGLFIEFSLSQIYMPVLYFPIQDNHLFFIWHPDNHPEIDILEPRFPIEGTGFLPSYFYINPKYVFTHGIRVLEIHREKRRAYVR